MKCNKCGHSIPDDSEFCQYCGEKIKSKNEEKFYANFTENDYNERNTTHYESKEKVETTAKKISNKSKVLILLLVASVVFNIYQAFSFQVYYDDCQAQIAEEKEKSNKTVSTQRGKIQKLETDLGILEGELEFAKEKAQFLDDYIVLVGNNNPYVYHKYDCPYLDMSYFTAYNVNLAEQQGFVPCKYCIWQ